jgi:hypothetical protein
MTGTVVDAGVKPGIVGMVVVVVVVVVVVAAGLVRSSSGVTRFSVGSDVTVVVRRDGSAMTFTESA